MQGENEVLQIKPDMTAFEALLKLIGFKSIKIIDENIGLVKENNKRKKEYQVVCNKGYTLFDETVTKVMVTDNEVKYNGEIGKLYVFCLSKYSVEDNVSDFFDMTSDEKAVLVSIGNKIYTNCRELERKYTVNKSIKCVDNQFEFNNRLYAIIDIDGDNVIHNLVQIK